MTVFMFETLDRDIFTMLSNHKLYPPRLSSGKIYNISSRPARAEKFDLMLNTLLEGLSKDFSKTNASSVLPKIQLAQRKFTDFDYKLIALCYGRTIHNWRCSMNDGFSKETGPSVQPMRVHFDRYLRENDETAIEAILFEFENFDRREDEKVVLARSKLDSLAEEVWIQALLEGKVI